jgi:hypothetical protein
MKQTAVEWLIEEIKSKADKLPTNTKENRMAKGIYVDCLLMARQAKEMENQQQGYSEEDMIAFGKSCFYKGFDKAENDDANCYTAFREEIGNLVKQFKNK